MGANRYLSVTKSASIAEARRRLSKAIRCNQRGCWVVRNITNCKWWQRPYKEPERWAMAQVHDPHTGEMVRDVLFSPDGRIGVVSKRKGDIIYIHEVQSPCVHWNMAETYRSLADKLPGQMAAATYPAWSDQPEPNSLVAFCARY